MVHADPLAVGVYVAIARLTLAAKGAVPLAAADLAAWMGSTHEADRAAIMRRIVKLNADGWLSITSEPAAKHRLLPTWGRDRWDVERPWRFDQADSGRPEHLRGRRVPIALFDTYVGRLDPQPGRRPALISRYLTRPLLDLTDIGTYTIGLRAEQQPTARLRHLKLAGEEGMLPPLDECDLLALVASDTLTTLDKNQVVVAVRLSMQGYARLGISAPMADARIIDEHLCRSAERSGSRSPADHAGAAISAAPEPDMQALDATTMGNTWDVGMQEEGIKHDPSTTTLFQPGGRATIPSACSSQRTPTADRQFIHEQPAHTLELLDPLVVAGHQELNRDRRIPPGEWWDLLALQQTHSARQLLIWQARAAQVRAARPHGVTPAYYTACAKHEALATYRPRRDPTTHVLDEPPPTSPAVAQLAVVPQRALDPTCRALLEAMGVQRPALCAGVSEALIRQWHAIIAHPGFAARFVDPVAFAVSQLRQQHPPPSITELECWAQRARERADPYQTWRHLPPVTLAPEQELEAQQRVARARGLLSPDADEMELTYLVMWLEEGLSDAEAVVHLWAYQMEAQRGSAKAAYG